MSTAETPTAIDRAIQRLAHAGWLITRRAPAVPVQPAEVAGGRYPHLPADFLEFLGKVERCETPDESAWLLCLDDLAVRNGEVASRHADPAERSELEALHDAERANSALRAFWDTHCPVALSVQGGYEHLSLSVKPERFGCVCEAYGADFEETVHVSDSFTELLGLLSGELRGGERVRFLQSFFVPEQLR